MNTQKSSELYIRAQKHLPGGVNSPVRAFQSVGRDPIFIKSAKGATLIDVDGNPFLDYIGSWGPAILGHGHEIVLEGVCEALGGGTSYGLPTELEVEMAELLSEALPSMEMLRMVSSGTEATMSALRVARGFTGREKIIKFEGCYHGHSDGLLVKTGSGALTYGMPTSAGVTSDVAKHTLVLEYNNTAQLRQAFEENKGLIAAVIVEPIPANMGVVAPDINFLKALSSMTRAEGALLIFDEVITGFRVGFGGAQSLFGIVPDLTCLGKIIGGGMPVGAYGGRRDIMSMVAPIGPVYQAGTLSGNPIAMRMGLNLLKHLKTHPEIYEALEAKAVLLQKGFEHNFEQTGISGTINRVHCLLSPFFTSGKVTSYEEVMRADSKQYAAYFNGMLQKGIMLPPAQFEAMFLSTAHTDEDVQRTIQAHLEVLSGLSN